MWLKLARMSDKLGEWRAWLNLISQSEEICHILPFSILGSLVPLWSYTGVAHSETFAIFSLKLKNFCLHYVTCRILVPRAGIELLPPAGEAQSFFNHWTTREVPPFFVFDHSGFQGTFPPDPSLFRLKKTTTTKQTPKLELRAGVSLDSVTLGRVSLGIESTEPAEGDGGWGLSGQGNTAPTRAPSSRIWVLSANKWKTLRLLDPLCQILQKGRKCLRICIAQGSP